MVGDRVIWTMYHSPLSSRTRAKRERGILRYSWIFCGANGCVRAIGTSEINPACCTDDTRRRKVPLSRGARGRDDSVNGRQIIR